MDSIDFTIFEKQALLQFLKDYINKENLSSYEGALPKHLFLAFVKLQNSIDEWKEAMAYTE